jgi:4-carboxymuconolactone decarboxylase
VATNSKASATGESSLVWPLAFMGASKGHIESHIRVALDLAVPKEDILEAIEIAMSEAGVVAFQHGFDARREVVGAEGSSRR